MKCRLGNREVGFIYMHIAAAAVSVFQSIVVSLLFDT